MRGRRGRKKEIKKVKSRSITEGERGVCVYGGGGGEEAKIKETGSENIKHKTSTVTE